MATTENSVVADDNQKVSLTGEELIIISPFIADPREYEIYLPEAQYIYENREYDLESYEVIEAVIEEHTKCVGDTITYDAVEQIDRVPGTCEIEATDDLSGQKNTVEAPLINYEYDNYRWINDFEFPVVVEAADEGAHKGGGMGLGAQHRPVVLLRHLHTTPGRAPGLGSGSALGPNTPASGQSAPAAGPRPSAPERWSPPAR